MGVVWLPLLLYCLSTGQLRAENPDSLSSRLDEIIVEGTGGRNVRATRDGNIKINLSSLQRGMRTMGEADVLNILKRSGGVSTIGDYGSGPVIQGSAPWQSIYRMNRAPVYFPYRFGGIFSTFNTPHFRSVSVERYSPGAAMPDRLGALIDLEPALQYARPLAVSANVGLLSSSATAKVSAAERLALTLSGRISYVDELYGRIIKSDINTLSYRFDDINASAGWKIDSLNTLTADFFTNSDRLSSGNGNYAMDTRLNWHNRVGSLRWSYAGAHAAELAAYCSEIATDLTVAFPQYDVNAPSGLHSAGLYGSTVALNGRGFIPTLTVGAEFIAYRITPMYATVGGELQRLGTAPIRQQPLSGRIFADAKFRPREYASFEVGISASGFGRFYSIDPRLKAELRSHGNTWTIGLGRYTQYLHNLGFSEIGLASNFWIGSGSIAKPQHSLAASATWSKPLLKDDLLLSASLYYKTVKSQTEYVGSILDIIDSDYSINRHILVADGYNTGIDIGLQKNFGALTGAVNYSFGRAMRRAGGETFRSINDAGHQFKADAEYIFNKHWSVYATFTYASGRVYTPTKYIYLLARQIITEYGARNSGRLPDYQRLDLGASYKFRTGNVTHLINLSIINAYGHKNVETQHFTIDTETLRYRLSRSYSLYRFLPSLSYSIDF